MAPLVDFSALDRWYRAEVHGEKFKFDDFMADEYSGERALFHINRRYQRSSANIGVLGAIGASWVTDADSPVGEDFVNVNGLLLRASDRDRFFPQAATVSSPKTKPANVDKPLPPVPKFSESEAAAHELPSCVSSTNLESSVSARIDTIPFDQMFVDANGTETTTVHGNGHSSAAPDERVEDDDNATTGAASPATPAVVHRHQAQPEGVTDVLDLSGIEASAIHAHASLLADIPTTTTDLVGYHVLAQGTNLAVPCFLNEEQERDKALATELYFNGPVEESPSPYHAPLLQDESGYGDVREGCEEFPEQWPQFEPESKHGTTNKIDDVSSSTGDYIPVMVDLTSERGAEIAESYGANELAGPNGLVDHIEAPNGAIAVTHADVVHEEPMLIDAIVDDHFVEASTTCKKRRACSSFAVKPPLDGDANGPDVECLYTKRVRFDEDDDENSSVGCPSVCSLVTKSDDDDDADFLDGVKSLPKPSFLAQVADITGFRGQFDGLQTSEQAGRATSSHANKVAVYIGQALHLNNLILHKDIHVCPDFGTTEFTPETAPTDSEIGRCISYADEMTYNAAEMDRSAAEETLRVTAHRECAAARLEGEVVGVYRYFNGSLTVEEYHERKMCICWQLCECSKLCTRFADMICPCADKLETNCC